MPRNNRVAPGGMVFHVLNRGNGRMRIFGKEGDYPAFEKVMRETLKMIPVRLLGYCLMPNHWHLVLWPRGDGELGRFMQRLTITHVRRWHEHRKTVGGGHVYQGIYKSFPVQNDEHLLAVMRYVESNALRARMVRRAEKWTWSSLGARLMGRREAVEMLSEWPVERPGDWVEMVNEVPEKEVEEVRMSVVKGRPFGGEIWQKRVGGRLGLESTFRGRGRPRMKEKGVEEGKE
ncbi:MAG TPA: transposase [Tepidisphaeraceae bacterium]|nr:transposase [Tepidisphaeraceae bacterium]